MPRKDKDFLGLEVISLKDASVIGEIDGLIVDETKDSVAGLVVNIGIKEAKVLSFADIASIGNDAVMVESEQVVCLVSGHAELQEIAERNIFLNGSLALTDSGDIAGAVADYYVDPKTGAITAIEIVPADEDEEAVVEFHKATTFTDREEDLVKLYVEIGNSFKARGMLDPARAAYFQASEYTDNPQLQEHLERSVQELAEPESKDTLDVDGHPNRTG